MRILWRYIASEYLKAFVAALLGVSAIYLVVDYVDRAKAYAGHGAAAVLELYAWKSITVVQQLAPAALLLAAGVALAGFRRGGEYTAMRALAVSPLGVLAPIAATCLALVGGLVLGDEYVVGKASRKVDEISVTRFRSYGDWRTYFGNNQWYRGQRHIYHFRGGDPEEGFDEVTVYSLSDDFRLAQRLDAKRMVAVEGGRWKFSEGTLRSLDGDSSTIEQFDERELQLDEGPSSFRILKGRPEQMPLRRLREQIQVRKNVGLPADRYVLALHNRLAYPLAGLPGAMLAFALAARPGRRGSLMAALAQGFTLIVLLWMLLVVCKAAALSGLMAASLAAWMPILLLAVGAGAALKGLAR